MRHYCACNVVFLLFRPLFRLAHVNPSFTARMFQDLLRATLHRLFRSRGGLSSPFPSHSDVRTVSCCGWSCPDPLLLFPLLSSPLPVFPLSFPFLLLLLLLLHLPYQLVLFKLVVLLFPMSDYRHPVTTPTLHLMTLSLSKVIEHQTVKLVTCDLDPNSKSIPL